MITNCCRCGKSFYIGPKRFEKYKGHFCSKKCHAATQKIPIKKRLIDSSSLNEKTGCIEWNKAISVNGYGRIGVDNVSTYAHRVAWEVFNESPIPTGMYVLHRCDNRKCINPDHLFIGTLVDNARDMMNKKRGNGQFGSGDNHKFRSKMCWEKVVALRGDYAGGSYTMRDLAKKYDISSGMVSDIIHHNIWKKQF